MILAATELGSRSQYQTLSKLPLTQPHANPLEAQTVISLDNAGIVVKYSRHSDGDGWLRTADWKDLK